MATKRHATVLTLILATTWGNAQEQRTEPRTVDTNRGPVVALPQLDATGPGSVVVDDIRFEMAVEGGFRVYRAHQERPHHPHGVRSGR